MAGYRILKAMEGSDAPIHVVVKSFAASIFFVLGLKMLSSPTTARRGNMVSAIGMLIAVVTALSAMAEIKWAWIIAGAGVGSTVGALAARLVKMTAMPQMVGLFNGFGGLASLLVGFSEFHGRWAGADATGLFTMVTMLLTSRRSIRTAWIAGAVLVSVVLIKMFFIDLGASGTVERIVSFLVVGSLLVAMGYFSPIPKKPDNSDTGEESHHA